MTIIIIGAGPGGCEAALEARKHGFDVILAESGLIGGTCLNAGCIPTKSYCRTAEILEEIRRAGFFGISAEEPSLDFSQVKRRKDEIVHSLRSGMEAMLDSAGVRLVKGVASFRDSRTVSVSGTDYAADWIIIATGSVPAVLDIPGKNLDGVLDSTALLELENIPGRLCIIGGGVIGLEFASIFRSFGSEVTVVEFCREILPRFDQDIAKRLRQSLSKKGVVFSLQSRVSSIEETVSGEGRRALKVNWERKEKEESCAADYVLMAAGRKPDVSMLNIEAAGVRTERGAVAVDQNMRTNVPHIFAIGDVNGHHMLAHAATFQGKKAIEAILAESSCLAPENLADEHCRRSEIDLSVMPSAVFTMPEAAAAGYTEEDCKSQGIECRVHKSFFRANGKAVCMGETEGMCKILASPEGRLLGCHILGPHAADLVQEVSSLMSAGASLDDLRGAVHIHPALGEVLVSAAESRS